MRIVLSSMRRPREVIGRVCKQEPDSFLEADKSLALDKGSGAVAKSSAAMEETLGRSHDFCRYYVYHQHISPRVTGSSNRPFFSKKYQSALALLSTLEEIGSIDSHVALALLRLCSGFSKLIHIARVTPPHLMPCSAMMWILTAPLQTGYFWYCLEAS